MESNKVEIEINGVSMRLSAPAEEHETIRKAATKVNATLREISARSANADTAKQAVQCALMIAIEFYQLMDDIANEHGTAKDILRRIDKMSHTLDETLNIQLDT